MENMEIRRLLSEKEIEVALTPEEYLGTALEQVKNMVEKTKEERKTRLQNV